MVGVVLKRLGEGFTTAVHYNSRNCDDLEGEIAELLAVDGMYASGACCRAQLNIANPDEEALARLRNRFQDLELILQIPLSIPELETIASLTKYLSRYGGLVDHVLLDPSGGRGTELSDELLETAAQALTVADGDYHVGIAGGLCGENLASRIGSARQELGSMPLSIDAETKLRGGRFEDVRVGDVLNPERVANYLREAVRVLG